jgi:CHAT domain-containing protein
MPTSRYYRRSNGDRITVADLVGRKLKTKMVVLSACQSAKGEITGGDEIMGFSRALLASGVQAVVVSMWPVDDIATTLLMEEFYKALRAGKHPAEAIWVAQNIIRDLNDVEIQKRQSAIADTVIAKTGEEMIGSFAGRVAIQGNDNQQVEASSSSNQNFRNPRFWAPFIVIGR